MTDEFKAPFIQAIHQHKFNIGRLLLLHGADAKIVLYEDACRCDGAIALAMEVELRGRNSLWKNILAHHEVYINTLSLLH